ncbi:tetratricopeptide repeat protein [Streptomyces sp. BPTC-684]|uniref:SEL1-like repeat protein n=1 Tax=Streptomyces sp. BPTC-684 TaxID=3043734 RepID=UPI0024B06D69|nr:tetratricopeptide repeat protein [Streptomyces sp. BPTC-684]WHM40261.1 tetratricopeptide repeat protein [Streptomyces sp. BPTC-684]
MASAPAPRGAALATLLPLVLGGAVLLASGTRAWPAWAAVVAVSVVSGAVALRRAAPPKPHSAPARSAPDEGGSAMYAMQRPVRGVPTNGLPDDVPYTLKVTTRSHLAVIGPPGSGTGSEAVHIPLTGHNLVFSLTADGPYEVTLVRLEARATRHASLVADGISMAHRRVPDMVYSPDLLESIQRSVEAFEPLKRPDFEVRLDDGPATVRPVGEDAPPLPLTVPGGESATLVLTPVTGSGAWVHWRLEAEIECEGRTHTPSWDLTVTATTGMVVHHPGGGRTSTPVHELYPDHWDPSAPAPEPGQDTANERFEVAAHISADGTGVLRGPSRPDPDPEPPEGLRLREAGDRHLAAGRVREAADAYRAAAEAGSGHGAFALGKLLHEQGDLVGAERWYERAAERRITAVFNNLGMAALQRGDTDRAERWYRRAMDEGDWTAVDGLGALMAGRGDDAQAETLWKLAADNGQPNAAQNLAVLLNRQGRTAEAEALWVRAAEAGNAGAAVHLGFLRHEAGDLKEAERWWRESAERGNSQGAYYFGVFLARAGRTDEAERWWRQAAGRLGDPENFTGSHMPTERGFGYALVQAAASGEALSAYELACLLDDKGDRAGAERWWTAAARAGHIEAVLRVAQVAMNDHDDLDGCLRWLRIAVEDKRTPLERLATAAGALHRLTGGLYDGTRPDNPDALAACALAVDAYERLHGQDATAYEQPYGQVLDSYARLSREAGDLGAADAADRRLSALGLRPG